MQLAKLINEIEQLSPDLIHEVEAALPSGFVASTLERFVVFRGLRRPHAALSAGIDEVTGRCERE